jgi:SAM-dependent methyltransferase
MCSDKPKPDLLYQIKNAARGAAAMFGGMELDLFTPLGDGPLNAKQLAARLEVKADKLTPLLYALVLTGLLDVNDSVFSNTPVSDEYLVRGKESFMGNAYLNWHCNLRAALKTPETIRSGVPQAKYDYRNVSDELRQLFDGMAAQDAVFACKLSENYDLSNHRRLLDAGGGTGTLSIALTEIHPQLTATVFDLPSVTHITQEYVEDHDAGDKVTIVSGDLTSDPIRGQYDLAILGSVIQCISRDEARNVILNVGNVVKPGGRLFIFGSGMLEDSRLAPRAAVEINLVFINVYDHGQSYTESEYRAWLEEAGFNQIEFRYDEFTIVAYKAE